MGFLNYKVRPRILVVGNGHSYDRTAFMAMFESFTGMECFLVEHPLAEQVLNPQSLADVDAVVLYDMPGGDPWAGDGYQVEPSAALKAGLPAMLEAGIPIVALHHAIAAWTTWPEYAEALGGALFHFPGKLRGKEVPDGGTRAGLAMTITAEDASHPLFKGLPPSFTLTDEAYLMEVFEDSVDVVARSDVEYSCRNLYSLKLAMTGERRSNRGWERPDGSNAVVWTKRSGRSALAYIQPGHDDAAYANPHYRQLVRNAIEWVISESDRSNG
ncbi:ThuA domain-containing protein [Xinfangfangia sp. CPCC 101601]|uniref:ThuA domain-containing protein n=1 Tax=Pseudogemmobacter lacusdianii TaxID=3069608 RepID=A0ABU0W1V8_9RHOB|nr:ThuA domain-containing protein [Xinfangfangia sp. CPCC 101601]MDQ2067949.1 ThuA domain-containing protein [Xinfangfangia sp. CPCC 101601]